MNGIGMHDVEFTKDQSKNKQQNQNSLEALVRWVTGYKLSLL